MENSEPSYPRRCAPAREFLSRHFAGGGDRLFAFPRALLQAMEIVEDENEDVWKSLARVVEMDRALMNLFQRRSQDEGRYDKQLEYKLARLGTVSVLEMLYYQHSQNLKGRLGKSMWRYLVVDIRRSILAGRLATKFAAGFEGALEGENVHGSDLYLAGLFADVGVLLMMSNDDVSGFVSEVREKAAAARRVCYHDFEFFAAEERGFPLHEEIGAELISEWADASAFAEDRQPRFVRNVRALVESHHGRRGNYCEEAMPIASALVQLAAHLAELLVSEPAADEVDEVHDKAAKHALARLGFDRKGVPWLAEARLEREKMNDELKKL
ncbi:MAG: HDOD domain-containing protein [Planctomycetes bacterium]|nr:HDOD domain-containing protein [Planctomycetota bacterium]